MIQIIKGTFGRCVRGHVVPTTAKDSPFTADPETEERLVYRGFARYVEEDPGTLEPETGEPDPENSPPVCDKSMKLTELREIAESRGIDCTRLRTKEEMITAIEAARDADEREPPPVLNAEAPVQ